MQFLEVLKLIISLFPLLIKAIQAVEDAIPISGKGADKLELLKSTVQVAYDTSNKLSVSFEQIWPSLAGTVKAIVTAFNNTGTFNK